MRSGGGWRWIYTEAGGVCACGDVDGWKREVVAGEATTTWSEPEGGPVNAGRRRDHHQQHYSRAP